MKTAILSVLSLCTVVPAQEPEVRVGDARASVRAPLDDGSGRELHLYAVGTIARAAVAARNATNTGAVEPEKAALAEAADGLREAIATFADPPLSNDEQVATLGQDHVVVLARPDKQAWVQRFLRQQLASAHVVASIELELFSASREAVQALGLGDEPRVLGAEEAKTFRASMLGADGDFLPGLERIDTARLSTFALQRARLWLGQRFTYVKDFEVELQGSHTMIANPVIGSIEDGTVFEGFFTVVDPATLAVSWEVRRNELQRPVPTVEHSLGAGQPVTIQTPRVVSAELRAAVELAPESIAVFCGPESVGERLVLVLSVPELIGLDRGR